MGRIYQCVGRYAETAYTIRRTWIHIHCVEELCYYICNNAYLLEEDFMNPELLHWLEVDCDLGTLAKKIRVQIRQGAKFEDQIRFLLEEIHYCPAEEIEEIGNMLAANRNMTSLQKKKIRADYFLKNSRYNLALQSYEELQHELDETSDYKIKASVQYNIGVIYAHLFLFDRAAAFFKQAFDIHPRKEYQVAYLAANRMLMPEVDYMKWLGKQEGVMESSEILEGVLTQYKSQYSSSDEYMKMQGLQHLRRVGNYEAFALQLDQQNISYKEQYRNMMTD